MLEKCKELVWVDQMCPRNQKSYILMFFNFLHNIESTIMWYSFIAELFFIKKKQINGILKQLLMTHFHNTHWLYLYLWSGYLLDSFVL